MSYLVSDTRSNLPMSSVGSYLKNKVNVGLGYVIYYMIAYRDLVEAQT